jgi:hypothetical protein
MDVEALEYFAFSANSRRATSSASFLRGAFLVSDTLNPA